MKTTRISRQHWLARKVALTLSLCPRESMSSSNIQAAFTAGKDYLRLRDAAPGP